MEYHIDRRAFLKTVTVATAGVSVGAGSASAAHSDEPTIVFPNGVAQVIDNQGPLQGAVQTRNVYMPDGGRVVISEDQRATETLGGSFQRLPAGHFNNLKVAVQPLPSGTYTLYATLSSDKGPEGYNWTQDSAEITFE